MTSKQSPLARQLGSRLLTICLACAALVCVNRWIYLMCKSPLLLWYTFWTWVLRRINLTLNSDLQFKFLPAFWAVKLKFWNYSILYTASTVKHRKCSSWKVEGKMLHLILQFLSTLEFSMLLFTDTSKDFIKKFGKHDEAFFQLHRVLLAWCF